MCTCILIYRHIKSLPPVYISSYIFDSLGNFVGSNPALIPCCWSLQHHFYFTVRLFVSCMAFGLLHPESADCFPLQTYCWDLRCPKNVKNKALAWKMEGDSLNLCTLCACASVPALWVNAGSLLSTASSQFPPGCTIFWQPVTKISRALVKCWAAGDVGTGDVEILTES